MKALLSSITIMLAGLSLGDGFHTFTDQQGRVVEARILRQEPKSGKIWLETKAQRKIWVDPKIFSTKDREYIARWLQMEPFLNPKTLLISIGKKDGEWKTTGKIGFTTRNRREKPTRYTIRLENTSDSAIDKIRMEYCLYIEKKSGSQSYIEVKPYSKTVGSLKPKEIIELRSVSGKNVRGTKSGGTDTGVGGCFRLYASSGKEEVMREIRHPRFLSEKKYPWKVPAKKKKYSF